MVVVNYNARRNEGKGTTWLLAAAAVVAAMFAALSTDGSVRAGAVNVINAVAGVERTFELPTDSYLPGRFAIAADATEGHVSTYEHD